jgi:hypothetical protein
MRKFYSVLLLCILVSFAQGQKKANFDMRLEGQPKPVPGALYSRVEFIDCRADTNNMGFVQGGFASDVWNVYSDPWLSDQMQEYVQAVNTGSGHDTILFQLRKLRFWVLSNFREHGIAVIRANAYAVKSGAYRFLGTVDSVYSVKKKGYTYKALFKHAGQIFRDYIDNMIVAKGADSALLTYNSMLHIDSIEKLRIPVYNTTTLTDGLYYSYKSFATQTPEIPEFKTKFKDTILKQIKIQMGPDEEVVKPGQLFVAVHKGKIWVDTELGYYQVRKIGNDFQFTGTIKKSSNGFATNMAGLMFGFVGVLITEMAGGRDTITQRIDHVTGDFEPVTEIAKTKK